MSETKVNLKEMLEKAFELTQLALKQVQKKDFDNLVKTLDNRERALNIIESLSENYSLHSKNPKNTPDSNYNNQVNQLITNIQRMDEIVMECLEYEKNKTQFEIAKTFKNKENFKGYNLNKLK